MSYSYLYSNSNIDSGAGAFHVVSTIEFSFAHHFSVRINTLIQSSDKLDTLKVDPGHLTTHPKTRISVVLFNNTQKALIGR